ncbi:LuxR family transcriptional regulator [Streptomyces spiroverticillatus]|uniref:LuxR family transcriptional regulator n=1 Tax=Streptomyces finlayi TaxID=67296 RepID=A0A919CDS1_9ACTN|nr:LuxR family transcriptional regulator [Streptomyces finlayi]GHA43261.1 LuxR family transcriptional regulator [Streptomyces spiroverticillatus]GHD13487.1 LuxR family transcriptional regulator [Streptomyces finlayi]
MLLERTSETAWVQDALHAAAVGRPSLLLCTGPLGIGKSSWLRELTRSLDVQNVRVMRATAAVMEQDFAFGVLHQLFDSLALNSSDGTNAPDESGVLDAPGGSAGEVASPLTAPLLAAGAGTPLPTGGEPRPEDLLPARMDDPSALREAILTDLCALLTRLGRERPLLILVDDVQWADTRSLELLSALAGRPHGVRAVLVCTLRDGDPRARHPQVCAVTDAATQVTRLASLSHAATGQLVREQLGESGDEEFVRACHRASGGNPAFLRALLPALDAAGVRPTAPHAGAVTALRPAPLRERLADCLRAQDPPVRDLSAAMAILGGESSCGLAGRLAGLDEIGEFDALGVLHRLGLLVAEGVAQFIHPVVGEAAEAFMSIAERGSWHARAAALLHETGHPAEEVAAQLMAAATPGDDWSAAVLRTAADAALRRGAPQEAARFLRRALLDSPEQGAERARLLIDLATAENAYDSAACERHIAQAVALLDSPYDRAAAALRISPGLLCAVSPSGVEILRQTAADLGPPARLNDSARELALRLEARLRYSARQDPAELAGAVRRLRERREEPAVASGAERESLAALLYAATLSGRLPAHEAARQATRILERVPATGPGSAHVLPLLTAVFTGADQVDALADWLAARERHQREAGEARDPLAQIELATVFLARGRMAHAREHAEQTFGKAANAQHGDSAASAVAVLAAVALETGDTALGERVRAGAGRGRATEDLLSTTMLRLTEAQMMFRRGELDRSLATVLACGRRLEAVGWRNPVLFPWRPRAIRLMQRSGDLESARALAEEEYAQARILGAPVAIGRAQQLRGSLRGDSEGTALLRDAVRVLRGSANELELARALRALSRALRVGAEARDLQCESAALAMACGVTWKTERDRSGTPDPADPQPEPSLTPTESRVAALAGSGFTNQAIATELGVGCRVVEKHLTNSYRKLGISGRRQLLALMAGTGTISTRT